MTVVTLNLIAGSLSLSKLILTGDSGASPGNDRFVTAKTWILRSSFFNFFKRLYFWTREGFPGRLKVPGNWIQVQRWFQPLELGFPRGFLLHLFFKKGLGSRDWGEGIFPGERFNRVPGGIWDHTFLRFLGSNFPGWL